MELEQDRARTFRPGALVAGGILLAVGPLLLIFMGLLVAARGLR